MSQRAGHRLFAYALALLAMVAVGPPVAEASWTQQTKGLGVSEIISGTSCPSSTTCYQKTYLSKFQKTTNRGATWTAVPNSHPGTGYGRLSCPTPARCVSTTTAGDIYLGTDTGSGLAWSGALTAGGGLYGVDCPSTSECFAVGSSGRVFRSTDAGSSWGLDATVPGTPTLLSVACPTTTVCYANEAAGAVYCRRADGSGWDQVATNPAMPDVLSPYTEHLSCPSVDTCYQAGTLGQIMKTTDGGSNWQPHLTSSAPDLYAIACATETRCIAVGVSASQYTGNGGVDWQQNTMGHTQYSVTWASLTTAFAGGSGSVPYRFDAPGILGFAAAPDDVLFPGLTLTGRDEVLTRVQTVGIDDQSGTGAGWSVSVTSTTFTSGSRTLPEHATRVMTAPANSCVGVCTLAVNTVSYPYTLPAGSTPPPATKVFTADTGSGQGRQDIDVTWSLAVPAWAYVGEYTSTWTFTLGSGP